MSKKQKEEKPLTPEQAASCAAGIAASQERRKQRAAQEAAAKDQADALAKWTGDKSPELLAGEIQQEFLDLNAKITAKLDIFTSKASDAKRSFDELIPYLDQMQAMLSERGCYRKLMNTLGLPTWSGWFKNFEKRCALDYSLRTVQRRLKERRGELGEEPKPEPSVYEDLFKRLNALVPSLSDGVEHVTVEALDKVTGIIADTKGQDLEPIDKSMLNYCIIHLETIARDFAAYAAAIKSAWTGRELWLKEQDERHERHAAQAKMAYSLIQGKWVGECKVDLSELAQPWTPPPTPVGPDGKKVEGWAKMKGGEKHNYGKSVGCEYCLTHSSARSCSVHGWKEKWNPKNRVREASILATALANSHSIEVTETGMGTATVEGIKELQQDSESGNVSSVN
jgi:hypothetical protein